MSLINVFAPGRGVVRNTATGSNVVKVGVSTAGAGTVRSEVNATVLVKAVPTGASMSHPSIKVDTRTGSVRGQQIVPVVDLPEGGTVEHELNSEKIDVVFFNAAGRKMNNMDWEVVDEGSFKVYLPYSDSPTEDSFTGEARIVRWD